MAVNKISSLLGEATKNFRADAAQRKAAAESPQSIILNAKDVKGEYDSGRTLMTTLGGIPRQITAEDLATFRQNIKTVQKVFKGGIRARQVLDMSLQIDRSRAQTEIRMAVPISAKNGMVRFATNASKGSKATRHHVNVEFLSFGAAAASGSSTAQKMANWVRKQSLKFDCDCGRHRYWFRYISTIGDFNAGRAETGFPKIRNPGLHGVACKHVLRVMAEVEASGTVLGFLTRLIQKAQDADNAKATHKTTVKEAEELVKKQSQRTRDIKTTDTRTQAREIAKERKALADAAKPVPPPKKATVTTRRAMPKAAPPVAPKVAPKAAPPAKVKKATINTSSLTPGQIAMAKQLGLTPEQVMALFAA